MINGDLLCMSRMCDMIIKIIKIDRKKINGQIFNIASFNLKLSDVGKKLEKIFQNKDSLF